MGHERVGNLPKSARWRRIIQDMMGVFASEVPVGALAAQSGASLQSCFPADKLGFPKNASIPRKGSLILHRVSLA